VDPSPEEISAGQKAYQRLRVFQSTTSSRGGFICVGIVFAALVCASLYFGDIKQTATLALVVGALIYSHRKQAEVARIDFEYLGQLKTKYGPAVYDVIRIEPTSLFYRLTQKFNFSSKDRELVELP
jgi:hypothetical protein